MMARDPQGKVGDDRERGMRAVLEAAATADDLDRLVEVEARALEAEAGADAPARLARLLGLSPERLRLRCGSGPVPAVAEARIRLIGSALAAAADAGTNDPPALARALARCAALSCDALGAPAAAERALALAPGLAAEKAGRFPGIAVDAAGLARVRDLALVDGPAALADIDAVPGLPSPELAPSADREPGPGDAAVAARALLDTLEDRLRLPAAAGGRRAGLLAALGGGGEGETPLDRRLARRVLAHVRGGSAAAVLASPVLDGAFGTQGRRIWQALARRPEFRVAAPILLAPARLLWRADRGESPRIRSLLDRLRAGGSPRSAAVGQLAEAVAVLSVLTRLADRGLITAALPEEPHAARAFAAAGRGPLRLGTAAAGTGFEAASALGALLRLAADAATVLAFRDPQTETAGGLLPLPDAGNEVGDYAVRTLLAAIPLLARVRHGMLSSLVAALAPAGGGGPDAEALGAIVAAAREPAPESGEFRRWNEETRHLWRTTAGLAAGIACRTDLWGHPEARPGGGLFAAPDPCGGDGETDPCARLLHGLGDPVDLPARRGLGDAEYWPFAARCGRAFRRDVEGLVSGTHPLAALFRPGEVDSRLQVLVLRRLARQRSDETRPLPQPGIVPDIRIRSHKDIQP